MTEPVVVDKALAVQGATPETSDAGAVDTKGNPAPAADLNTPPVKVEEPVVKTAEEIAAETAAAEAVAAAEAENAALDTDVWGTTGDDVGDSVMALLQNSGVSVEDAKVLMYDAFKSGDATKVDRDALIEKVGAAKATLIMAGTENFLTRATTTAQTILKEVVGAVGGEANWKAVADWAAKSFTADQITEYKGMIDKGGAQARFAAQEMAAQYNADGKNTTLDASSAEITPDTAAPSTARSITRQQYSAEMSKANKAGDQRAMQEIQQARERGRAAGI